MACALKALWHIHNASIVMIHDFHNRHRYHSVLEFYDVVDSADTLVVLSRKQELRAADMQRARTLLSEKMQDTE